MYAAFRLLPLLTFILSTAAWPLSAQDRPGSLSGRVQDAETREPLPAVNLYLEGTSFGTVSDTAGDFRFPDLPAGTYQLKASFVGYRDTAMYEVLVRPGEDTRLDLSMQYGIDLPKEVVVTAQARPGTALLVPASLGVVSAADLAVRPLTTFDQAFDEMPGVVVTRSGNANVQAFSIRGASEVAGGGIGNRVLLLIDGRPALSPESGGALWNLVPLSSIERIEVLRGAFSSLYGSSAMGGVVNVITRQPSRAPTLKAELSYGCYDPFVDRPGYSGYHDLHTVSLSHAHRIGRFSYLIDGRLSSDKGYREKSAFSLWNLFGKSRWDLSDKQALTLTLNTNRIASDAPATWLSRRQAFQVADFKLDDFQDRREYNLDLLYTDQLSDRTKLSARLYHYGNDSFFRFDTTSADSDRPNVNLGKQIVREYSVSTRRWGHITQINTRLGERHFLVGGLDLKWDDVVGLPAEFLYGEHQALTTSCFLQDEFQLNNRWTLTAGIRYDRFSILRQNTSTNISPKLASLYRINPRLVLRTLAAQAFRDPPIAERFIRFEQGGGLRFLPNPQLQPERLRLSLEVGLKYKPTPAWTLDGALFYNHYRNLISFVQRSAPLEPLLYQVVNLKSARMQGAECSVRYQYRDFLQLSLSYTFLDASDTSPDRVNDALAYKVRHSGGASATWMYRDWTVHLNGRHRSRIEEVFIYPGSEPGAVWLANLRLARQWAGKYSAHLSVQNINDAQYEELERYRMPGRTYSVGISATWN